MEKVIPIDSTACLSQNLPSPELLFISGVFQVPPGLTLCQKELGAIAGQFVRLVNYNKEVFGDVYADIINNHCLFRDGSFVW